MEVIRIKARKSFKDDDDIKAKKKKKKSNMKKSSSKKKSKNKKKKNKSKNRTEFGSSYMLLTPEDNKKYTARKQFKGRFFKNIMDSIKLRVNVDANVDVEISDENIIKFVTKGTQIAKAIYTTWL